MGQMIQICTEARMGPVVSFTRLIIFLIMQRDSIIYTHIVSERQSHKAYFQFLNSVSKTVNNQMQQSIKTLEVSTRFVEDKGKQIRSPL